MFICGAMWGKPDIALIPLGMHWIYGMWNILLECEYSFLIYHHHLSETRVCFSIYRETIILPMQWTIQWIYSREKLLVSQWKVWTLEQMFIDKTTMCQILFIQIWKNTLPILGGHFQSRLRIAYIGLVLHYSFM